MWHDRIVKALKAGEFSGRDRHDATDWPSCAVGEVFSHDAPVKVRQQYHEQLDGWLSMFYPKFSTLGMEFYKAVTGNKPREALRIYKQIRKLAESIFA